MDLYDILGVSRTATPDEIDRAYRSQARRWHPDRNPGDDEAVKKFKEINSAFEVLGHPSKKSEYDVRGYAGRRPPAPPPPDVPKPKFKTKEDFERENAERKRREHQRDSPAPQRELDEIKCDFFGGGSTGRNVLVQMKLTPEEMRRPGSKMVRYKIRHPCHRCVGDGEGMRPCPKCHGSRPDVGWCPACDGQGAVTDKCAACGGTGLSFWKVADVKAAWSGGIQPGHTITILGEGEAAPGKAPGNVRVVVV